MCNQVFIRDFIPDDYKAITSLINELGYPTSDEEARERLERINSDQSLRTLVAEIDDEIVGFIGLSKSYSYESGCFIRITALIVTGSYRGNGIGTKLVQAAEEWAKREQALSLVLSSGINRKDTHKFYENKGYCIKGYSFFKKL